MKTRSMDLAPVLKLPIDMGCIYFIWQFRHSCGLNARECILPAVLYPMQSMLGDFIVWWSSLILVSIDNDRAHYGGPEI